jgi:hypothetical protein
MPGSPDPQSAYHNVPFGSNLAESLKAVKAEINILKRMKKKSLPPENYD